MATRTRTWADIFVIAVLAHGLIALGGLPRELNLDRRRPSARRRGIRPALNRPIEPLLLVIRDSPPFPLPGLGWVMAALREKSNISINGSLFASRRVSAAKSKVASMKRVMAV